MELPVRANIDIAQFLVLNNPQTNVQWKCSEFAVKMLEEAVHADITFEVAEGDCVKAHRNVLATVSPVFAAMFSHDMKEKLTATVKISDMTIDALKLFLLLLYTTKDNNDAGVPELNSAIDKHFDEFHAAVEKYQVTSLLGSLDDSALARNLNSDNCWMYLDQSIRYGRRANRRTCRFYIRINFKDVIESDSFLDAMRFNPSDVCSTIRFSLRNRKITDDFGRQEQTSDGRLGEVQRFS